MGRKEMLIGSKYNRLTILGYAHTKNGQVFWKCQCDCGNICCVRGDRIRIGTTKSCGCLNRERSKILKRTRSKNKI